MKYSEQLPSGFNQNSSVLNFFTVLDKLEEWKQLSLEKGVKLSNPIMSSSRKAILPRFVDLGFPRPTSQFPTELLQVGILSAGRLFSYLGT